MSIIEVKFPGPPEEKGPSETERVIALLERVADSLDKISEVVEARRTEELHGD